MAVAYVVASSDHVEAPFALATLTVVVATEFIAVGCLLWARSRENRVGLLVVAIGLATLIQSLDAADSTALSMVGTFAGRIVPVMLVHLLMIYPNGALDARYQRGIVALGYFDAFVLAVPAVLASGSNDDLFQAITVARLSVDAVITTGLAIALSRRWYAAVPTQQAVLAPVYWSGGATLATFAVTFVSEVAGASDKLVDGLELGVLAVAATIPFALAFGVVKGRFTRAGAVSDFVARLADREFANTDLRNALSQALGDPTLELAYWLPDRESYVRPNGQAVVPPEPKSGRLWHSVELNGEVIAAIIYDESIGDQSALVQAAGGAAALSLRNKRLEAELRARVDELRQSRARLVEATDSERKRIERDLHDGAQQHLLSIALDLSLGLVRLEDDPEGAAALFNAATENLTRVADELRDLARGIHPSILTDRGLAGALSALAGRAAMRVEVSAVPDKRLPPQVESTAYFVAAEALTNVARHADATYVSIRVVDEDGAVSVEIQDDGVGGADRAKGTGLSGLADRVEALDGHLEVVSRPNEGTLVRAKFTSRPSHARSQPTALAGSESAEEL